MNWLKAFAARAATALTAALLLICGAGQAQSEYQFIPERELVIATKEAPPFVMKRSDGTLSGISIDLWRQIAEQLHLRYHFSEHETVQELLRGIEEGSFDAAIAAVTATGARGRFHAAILFNRPGRGRARMRMHGPPSCVLCFPSASFKPCWHWYSLRCALDVS